MESLALHCPMLETLEVDAGVTVDPVRLFENLEQPLKVLVDRSPSAEHGRGLDRRRLAWVIASGGYPFARELQRVQLGRSAKEERTMLKVACAARGVHLVWRRAHATASSPPH